MKMIGLWIASKVAWLIWPRECWREYQKAREMDLASPIGACTYCKAVRATCIEAGERCKHPRLRTVLPKGQLEK